MRFLKRHYEKIILSVILAGLGATAYWFYGAVGAARDRVPDPPPIPKKTKWTPLNFSNEWNALKTFNQPPEIDLSGEHNLFSPVTWKRSPDGWLFKVTKEGPKALVVAKIDPLYYVITYDRRNGPSFALTARHGNGKVDSRFLTVGEKDRSLDFFIANAVDGPDGNPTLTLSFPATGEAGTVTAAQPYKKVDGYTVNLHYPPDNAMFTKEHINDTITLSGSQYKIVAITSTNVTVLETNNGKRTIVP